VAHGGQIFRDIEAEELRQKLQELQKSQQDTTTVDMLKRRFKHEE
jgi:hypothetical protein